MFAKAAAPASFTLALLIFEKFRKTNHTRNQQANSIFALGSQSLKSLTCKKTLGISESCAKLGNLLPCTFYVQICK